MSQDETKMRNFLKKYVSWDRRRNLKSPREVKDSGMGGLTFFNSIIAINSKPTQRDLINNVKFGVFLRRNIR